MTVRQQEIADLKARGLTYKEIEKQLAISSTSVSKALKDPEVKAYLDQKAIKPSLQSVDTLQKEGRLMAYQQVLDSLLAIAKEEGIKDSKGLNDKLLTYILKYGDLIAKEQGAYKIEPQKDEIPQKLIGGIDLDGI